MSSHHGNPSHTDGQTFHSIAQDITRYLDKILTSRPYVAIADLAGTIHYIDPPLERFLVFIQNFVKSNFNLLKPGDHSLPLGGVNLAFFKVSGKAMVILYTLKGKTGQLLAFKTRMFEWTSNLDKLLKHIKPPAEPDLIQDLIARIEVLEQETSTNSASHPEKKQGIKIVPLLTKELTGKEKFSIETAKILQFCDGDHTITQIRDATGYSLIKINEIIRTYQKKKWVVLKRII